MSSKIQQRLVEFGVGLVFGLGLLVSGMSNPHKVLGFLDVAGVWDPSLALVMGGALVVAFWAFRRVHKRSQSLLGLPMNLPSAKALSPRLVWGSLSFGVGWGLAGYCPGPALVGMALGNTSAWVFGASMLAGMALFEGLERWKAAAKS